MHHSHLGKGATVVRKPADPHESLRSVRRQKLKPARLLHSIRHISCSYVPTGWANPRPSMKTDDRTTINTMRPT